MGGFAFNPSAPELWESNAVLNGRARRYGDGSYVGTLSIKTVRSGSAKWITHDGEYTVTPESFLVLNHGQSYSMQIESVEPVETFCVFFRQGFLAERRARFLDEGVGSPGFYERLAPMTAGLRRLLDDAGRVTTNGAHQDLEGDDVMARLGDALLGLGQRSRAERERLEHARASTRDEIYRRMNLARDSVLDQLDASHRLEELASVAGLSPYHFHRLHVQAFGETPHEFVTRARLERAKRLLRSGRDVSTVAVELGFSSVPTFVRLFKSNVGMTPGAFRTA